MLHPWRIPNTLRWEAVHPGLRGETGSGGSNSMTYGHIPGTVRLLNTNNMIHVSGMVISTTGVRPYFRDDLNITFTLYVRSCCCAGGTVAY